MPLNHAPSPLAPRPRPPSSGGYGRVLAAGVLGVAACVGLALAGGARPWPAAAAAVLVLAAAGLLARGAGRPETAGEPAADAGPVEPPFAQAFDALPDPLMWVTAGDVDDQAARRIAFANRAARELLRIPRSGALLVAAVRRPEVLEALDESLFGRRPRRAAFEGAGAPDRFTTAWTFPLEAQPTAAVGGEELRHALLLLRDETEARRVERARVDFLANASHELRTPLASLSGFIETLRGHAKEDPVARERFLGIMAAQTDRMGRLTEDLLQLSRAELNEHVPPQGRCDLAAAVSDVADALAPLAAEHGARLELDLPGRGEAEVVGDRDQLVQVVQNLLANALKYSPRGGRVSVQVGPGSPAEDWAPLPALAPPTPAAADLDPFAPTLGAGAARSAILAPDRASERRWLRLRVTDEGPGVAREHLPRLAERFYRVEGQKSGERAGTGLGLAIVKHIVSRHRGGLMVESAPGRGSTFTVHLPRAERPGGVT